VRVMDFPSVDAALGEFFAGERERVVSEFESGQAQAFAASGPGYGGLILLRFERRLVDGALQCHVITARGEGTLIAMADLSRIARQAGAVAITSDASDASVIRMYARAGWEVESCRLRLELEP